MDKSPKNMNIAETKAAYSDMAAVADERLLMKLEELAIKLAQTLGQLLIRKEALEEQLELVTTAISENRGAATLMKEIQDFQYDLMKAHEQERLLRGAKMRGWKKDEESPEGMGQGTLDSQ